MACLKKLIEMMTIYFQALILTVKTKGIEEFDAACWYCFVLLHALYIFEYLITQK